MHIRAATEEDFPRLCRLWAEVDKLHAELLPRYFCGPAEPPRSRSFLRRQLLADDLLTLVADEQGEVVGLAEARLVDTPDQPQLTPCRRVYVETLMVASRWRRRGTGRALLAATEVWGKQRAASEILLTVWAGNREAEAFYDKLGFRRLNQVLGRPL